MDLDESNQDEKAVSICAFAADVMSRMEDTPSFLPWMHENEVQDALARTFRMFPLSPTTLSSRSLKLLDTSATALWNAFTRFLQRIDGLFEIDSLLLRVPLLASHMLECCCLGSWKLLQVLIKSAEFCLGADMIEEATDALQRATVRFETVDPNELCDVDVQKYVAKYHIISAWMALKNGNLEEASLNISRFPQEAIKTSPFLGEHYVSTCLSALRQASKTGLKDLGESSMQILSQTFGSLRQCGHAVIDNQKLNSELFYTLGTTSFKDMSETFNNLASELLQVVQQGYEGHIDHILRLEMMARHDEPDIKMFYRALADYINATEPTMDNFKRSLQYACKFRFQDPGEAMIVLRLLYGKINLFPHDENWLQQSFAAMMRLVASPPWKYSECLQFYNDIAGLFQNEVLSKSLSMAASNASLIILWKYIESASLKGDYLEAQEWCRFGQHALFQRASPSNRANILRRLIYCSFQIGNFSEIKRTWELLSKEERDPTTIRIMYQTSLRDSNLTLAANLLVSIIELENGEHRYALAAIAAAGCSQLRGEALQSVYVLLEEYPIVLKKKPINLDLHRVLIRLIYCELREHAEDTQPLMKQICEVLTWVIRELRQDQPDSNDHDWFVRSTYTLLLEASRDWAAEYLLLFLNICLELVDRYPNDVGSHVKSEIHQRRVSCNLLGMLIYTNMARKETNPDKKVTSRYNDIQAGSNIVSETILTAKQYCQVICFNLEANIYLEKWAEAEGFIRETSAVSEGDDIHSIMADIILTSARIPHDYLIRSLQVLLKHTTPAKLPAFIRCIFNLCIHNYQSNTTLLETILDQAYIFAQDKSSSSSTTTTTTRDANDGQLEVVYQDEELEYLSTTSFNLAVDLYLAGRRDDAQRWARKAIGLARLIRDDCDRGRLTQVLEAKYGKWLTYGT